MSVEKLDIIRGSRTVARALRLRKSVDLRNYDHLVPTVFAPAAWEIMKMQLKVPGSMSVTRSK